MSDGPVNLFGEPIATVNDSPYRGKQKRKSTIRKGYAWTPGTGPAGESCGSCSHLCRVRMAKTYLKCGKNRTNWSRGPRTDILAKSPACKFWEAGKTQAEIER